MATGHTVRSGPSGTRTRRWRGVLAALISLALVFSFLHDWSIDADSGALTVASVQIDGAAADKAAPDWGAPHGDHCLAHLTTVAPYDSAVPIEYAARPFGFAAALLPDAADLASPFKPPRA